MGGRGRRKGGDGRGVEEGGMREDGEEGGWEDGRGRMEGCV